MSGCCRVNIAYLPEVEYLIYELCQGLHIPVYHVHEAAFLSLYARVGIELLCGPCDERQRCPQLVSDIGEEYHACVGHILQLAV